MDWAHVFWLRARRLTARTLVGSWSAFWAWDSFLPLRVVLMCSFSLPYCDHRFVPTSANGHLIYSQYLANRNIVALDIFICLLLNVCARFCWWDVAGSRRCVSRRSESTDFPAPERPEPRPPTARQRLPRPHGRSAVNGAGAFGPDAQWGQAPFHSFTDHRVLLISERQWVSVHSACFILVGGQSLLCSAWKSLVG